jgi:hypothetical protein
MDLLLDYVSGDLAWKNGPLTVDYTTQPLVDTVKQRLFIMLRTFQGEWFMDLNHGIPYWQNILGKKTTKSAIDLIFQQKILAENGVKEITEFKSTFVNRQYSLNFKVRVSTGEVTDMITINPIT